MSKSRTQSDSSTAVRYSADDRLEPRAYEQLLRGALGLDTAFAIQSEFAIMAAGRLGMRSGEIAHMREEWINWRDQKIHIPRREPCDKGRDGGPCGHCRQLARQKVECDPERDLEDVLASTWQPKQSSVKPFSYVTSERVN